MSHASVRLRSRPKSRSPARPPKLTAATSNAASPSSPPPSSSSVPSSRRRILELRGSTSVSYATTVRFRAEGPSLVNTTTAAGQQPVVVVDPDSVQHYRNHDRSSAVGSAVFHALCDTFLPEGYPDSVSSDYLAYQVWDTAQALCSSVTGTLSTRSVLRGVGVGSAEANVMSSTMSHVLRDGVAMISRLLFASKVATDLDYDAKRWRYVADVTNDTALFLEVFSSYLPGVWFLLSVCVASVFKAITGVAGGGARASLTQHFAKRQNAADLSSKEGSQETLANLLGMALGMFTAWLVPDESFVGTTTVFAVVTLMHLYCNYRAVTSLTLTYLNRQRFALLMRCFLGGGGATDRNLSSSLSLPSPVEMSTLEGVLWWNPRAIDILPTDITFGASLMQVFADNDDDQRRSQRGRESGGGCDVVGVTMEEVLESLNAVGYAVLVRTIARTEDRDIRRYAVFFRDVSPPAAALLESLFRIAMDHHHNNHQNLSAGTTIPQPFDGPSTARTPWMTLSAPFRPSSSFADFCTAARSAGWDLDRAQIRSEGWCVREQKS